MEARKNLAGIDSFGVVPELVKQRSDGDKHGNKSITHSNPPVRETINLNNFMIDEDGDPRILFIPESNLQSGGVPASVANAEYDMTSKMDNTNDRSEDRSLPRTHFFDGARYVVCFVNGRLIHLNPSEMKDRMDGAEVEEKTTFSNEEEGKVRAMRSLQNTGGITFG